MVSEVSVYQGREGVVEQSSSYHSSQEAETETERKRYRKGS
jgi:hypothetical protein